MDDSDGLFATPLEGSADFLLGVSREMEIEGGAPAADGDEEDGMEMVEDGGGSDSSSDSDSESSSSSSSDSGDGSSDDAAGEAHAVDAAIAPGYDSASPAVVPTPSSGRKPMASLRITLSTPPMPATVGAASPSPPASSKRKRAPEDNGEPGVAATVKLAQAKKARADRKSDCAEKRTMLTEYLALLKQMSERLRKKRQLRALQNKQREKELGVKVRELDRRDALESKLAAKEEAQRAREKQKVERAREKALKNQEKQMIRAEKERLRLAEREKKLAHLQRLKEEAAQKRKEEIELRRVEREKARQEEKERKRVAREAARLQMLEQQRLAELARENLREDSSLPIDDAAPSIPAPMALDLKSMAPAAIRTAKGRSAAAFRELPPAAFPDLLALAEFFIQFREVLSAAVGREIEVSLDSVWIAMCGTDSRALKPAADLHGALLKVLQGDDLVDKVVQTDFLPLFEPDVLTFSDTVRLFLETNRSFAAEHPGVLEQLVAADYHEMLPLDRLAVLGYLRDLTLQTRAVRKFINDTVPDKMKAIRKRMRELQQQESELGKGLHQETVKNLCSQLLLTVEDAVDSDGAQLCEIFKELVSAEDYPQYYEIIETPISLEQIAEKTMEDRYSSFEECVADFDLMFENARTFNHPDSWVYLRANDLDAVTKEAARPLGIRAKLVASYRASVQQHAAAVAKEKERVSAETKARAAEEKAKASRVGAADTAGALEADGGNLAASPPVPDAPASVSVVSRILSPPPTDVKCTAYSQEIQELRTKHENQRRHERAEILGRDRHMNAYLLFDTLPGLFVMRHEHFVGSRPPKFTPAAAAAAAVDDMDLSSPSIDAVSDTVASSPRTHAAAATSDENGETDSNVDPVLEAADGEDGDVNDGSRPDTPSMMETEHAIDQPKEQAAELAVFMLRGREFSEVNAAFDETTESAEVRKQHESANPVVAAWSRHEDQSSLTTLMGALNKEGYREFNLLEVLESRQRAVLTSIGMVDKGGAASASSHDAEEISTAKALLHSRLQTLLLRMETRFHQTRGMVEKMPTVPCEWTGQRFDRNKWREGVKEAKTLPELRDAMIHISRYLSDKRLRSLWSQRSYHRHWANAVTACNTYASLGVLTIGLLECVKKDKRDVKKGAVDDSVEDEVPVAVEKETVVDKYSNAECAKCGDGDDLLCCDSCPLSYHIECLEPPLTEMPEGKWRCPPCTNMYQKSGYVNMSAQVKDEDTCRLCGIGGQLMWCDSCPNVFHLGCLDPPLLEVPDGDWFCSDCNVVRPLVFGKVRGHPLWPARIMVGRGEKAKGQFNKAQLYFFGSHDLQWVGHKNIQSFLSIKSLDSVKCADAKKAKLTEAFEEATKYGENIRRVCKEEGKPDPLAEPLQTFLDSYQAGNLDGAELPYIDESAQCSFEGEHGQCKLTRVKGMQFCAFHAGVFGNAFVHGMPLQSAKVES